MEVDLDSISFIYDRDSLHERLTFIQEEQLGLYRNLLVELYKREEQVRVEHRTFLVRIRELFRLWPVNIEKVYEEDPVILDINRLVNEVGSKIESISAVIISNHTKKAFVNL